MSKHPPESLDTETRLRRRVKDAIVSQDLSPGEKVTEVALAESFGTSRTIARSLIDQLTAQGFLVSVSPRITRVAPLTILNIKENFALRKTLLPDIAAISIANINVSELKRTNDAMSKTSISRKNKQQILTLLKKNRDYNLLVSQNLKYPLMLSWARILEDMAMRIYWLYLARHNALPFAAANHLILIDAIEQNEPDKVREIIFKIISQNEEVILNSIFSDEKYQTQNLLS